ncbi:hypothetical protein scyTo_0014566 [Scyliorhinus torazame]|uniref:Uncharacterized protein n=1 Tax=Scyliorhinus torazame TaxID=75743 RepID=A0A401NQ10_SCYTO|nr:hypothetical protein [Scyliorhinus torazame]
MITSVRNKENIKSTMPLFETLNLEEEDWSLYAECGRYSFHANDMEEDDGHKINLFTACRALAFSIIKSLTSCSPDTKMFNELVDLVKNHSVPKLSVILQHYPSNMAERAPGEPVTELLAILRRMAEYCEFGPSLIQMLRDRLVCGINNVETQNQLLAEPTLDVESAIELVLSLENTGKWAPRTPRGDGQ